MIQKEYIKKLAMASIWQPLHKPLFRALWIATVASNIGTWMQDVGAAWLMTSLAPSSFMVALVRAASSLPMFLFALPGGALADVVDRRRLLLVTQSWMLFAAMALGILTMTGLTTPWVLLLLTFILGVGTALNAPAWQAIIPELVSRNQLITAISLNSISINLARSIGPAIGGLIIAAVGPGATFILNALSFCGVIIVLYRWQRPQEEHLLPAERMMAAMRAGLQYVRYTTAVQIVLVRSSAFILFGSALWALLPAVARFEFGRGPAGYGVLLGFFGAGAVAGATLLPGMRAKFSVNKIVSIATMVFAAMLLVLAFVRDFWVACAALVAAGGGWLVLLSTFNSSIQAIVPSWVRGRAMAVSIVVFFGGMAAGSAFWGYVASRFSISIALYAATIGVLAGFMVTHRYRLQSGEELDFTPSVHWPHRPWRIRQSQSKGQ